MQLRVARLHIILCTLLTFSGNTMAASIGGKLELEDYGSFFVNARNFKSDHAGSSLVTGKSPPGNIKVNQMYVQYLPSTHWSRCSTKSARR